jgi:hypothetical protein
MVSGHSLYHIGCIIILLKTKLPSLEQAAQDFQVDDLSLIAFLPPSTSASITAATLTTVSL